MAKRLPSKLPYLLLIPKATARWACSTPVGLRTYLVFSCLWDQRFQ